MKRLLKSSTNKVKKWLMRDAHDDTVYVHTEVDNDAELELNKRIRSAGLMKIGQRFTPIDDHADIAVQFQFPTTTDYHLARQKYPDIFAELDQGGDQSIKAGERLALLMPEYVTTVRNRSYVAVAENRHAR